ncbi:MAG: hypothetical protein Q8M06_06690 [Methanobacteriaceae archaeon]|nr:hypothetical protein [Methanobacteriaceae archaeon]MDZ4172837.1 hypothetical protein [Methanobacteriaceae archaeon]
MISIEYRVFYSDLFNKKIVPDYKRLTNFMEDHKIPQTSNTVENYSDKQNQNK